MMIGYLNMNDPTFPEDHPRNHPAFAALTDCFRKSTYSPEHLAFLVLSRLQGFEVVEKYPTQEDTWRDPTNL